MCLKTIKEVRNLVINDIESFYDCSKLDRMSVATIHLRIKISEMNFHIRFLDTIIRHQLTLQRF